jgi:hypothetical protein
MKIDVQRKKERFNIVSKIENRPPPFLFSLPQLQGTNIHEN